MVPNAVNLKTPTDKLLRLYEGSPKDSITMGQACVCFRCGYVGLCLDYDEVWTTMRVEKLQGLVQV